MGKNEIRALLVLAMLICVVIIFVLVCTGGIR
jgi:hypothetical protein